jgi:hypothetical protein
VGAFFLILATAALAGTPNNCITPPSGISFWLEGENDARDTTGQLPDGSIRGVGFASGFKGQAFLFNGTNNYVTNQTTRLSWISNSYTMEFWVRPAAARASTTESQSGISGGASQRYAIFPDKGENGYVGSGVSVGTNGISVFEHGGSYLPALLVYDTPILTWTHLAVVYSNRQPALYLNGSLVRVGLISTQDSNPSTSLGEEGYGYGYYAGLLDEVSIYDRPLNDAEIQAIYLAGTNGKCPQPPFLISKSEDLYLLSTSPANFSARIGGSSTMAFQWFYQGIPISGETQSNFTIPSAQPSDAGTYSLLASNFLDSITASINLSVSNASSCVPAPTGISFWMEGENDTRDATGDFLEGYLNEVTFGPGLKGQAFLFNGTNSFITNQTTRLSWISNSYTMEFWALPSAARAFTKESQSGISGSAGQRYAIFPNKGENGYVGSGVSVGTNGVSVFEHGGSYLPALLVYDTPITTWTHVAVVYSNSQPALFLNGSLVHVGLPSSRISNPSTSLGEQDYGYGFYAGLLDEVSIYDRALTQGEIRAIYLSGSNGKCPQPPVFVAQPADQILLPPMTAFFSAVCAGASPMGFQWFHNGEPVLGATQRSLTIPAVVPSDTGLYSLVASNAEGSLTSGKAHLILMDPSPCIAAPAGLSVWFEGENNFRDATANLPAGTNINSVGFGPGMAGQAFLFNGTNSYVTNQFNRLSSISNSYTMEFWAWPTAARLLTPETQDGEAGTTNQRYAIFPSGFPIAVAGAGVSVGTNGVSVFEHSDEYLPSLLVYDTPILTWTHVAVVYSNRQPSLYLNGKLARVGLPSTRDSNPSTSLGEDGFGYGNYAGLLDEVAIYDRPLSVDEIQATYLAGSNGKCATAPFLLTQPADQIVLPSTAASFAVFCGGSSPLGFQWLHDGAPVAGATQSSLIIPLAQPSDAGGYSVLVSNSAGSVTSVTAQLTVLTPTPCVAPSSGIKLLLEGENESRDALGNFRLVTNNSVSFSQGMKGQAFVFNGTNSYVTSDVKRLASVSNSYTMEFWAWPQAARATTRQTRNVSTGTNGQRYAIFPNRGEDGLAGSGVSVGINGVSVFEQTNGSLPSLLVYDTPIVSWIHVAVVYSNRQPALYLNGNLVKIGLVSSRDSNPSTSLGEEGFGYGYYAGLLDEVSIYDRPLSAAEIRAIYLASSNGKCLLAPSFIGQPADQVAWPGTAASFSTLLAGSGPMVYQWFHEGSPITSATQSFYTISAAQASDAGGYSLQVSNSAGSVTSVLAQLTVLTPAPCVAAPAGLSVWFEGENETRDTMANLFHWSTVNGDGFRPGIKGQAFSFNGTNSYIIDQVKRLSAISNSYTMEFWTWPAALRASTTENASGISSKADQRYAIFPNYNGTAVAGAGVSVGNNGVSVFESAPVTLASLLVYDTPILTWTHVAVVYSNRQPALYLNGNLVRVGLFSPRDSNPSTSLGEEGFGYGYYAGLLDEVGIYNRALAPQEIRDIYLAGVNGKCSLAPSFVRQPANLAAWPGKPALFSALLAGSAPLALQWFHDDSPITGATQSFYNISAAQVSDTGAYSLQASNSAGTMTSVPAQLTLLTPTPCAIAPASLSVWMEGENDTRDTMGSLFNSSTINGDGFRSGMRGQAFSFNGINSYITNKVKRLSAISNSYTMEFWAWPTAARASSTESQSGTSGVASQRYAIFPNPGGNGFVGSGVSVGTNGVSVFEHGNFYLPALLVYDAPILTWIHVAVVYSNRRPALYLNGNLVRVGLTSALNSNPSTSLGEEGFGYGYYAGLLDEVGVYNRSLTPLEIRAIYLAGVNGKCPIAPFFIKQPADQLVWPGTAASFSAVVAGSVPLAYQWFHNESPIAGATQSVLTIPVAQPSDVGSYSLQASNSAGFVTSLAAQLTRYASNSCIAAPAGLNLWLEGENEIRDSMGNLFNWSIINSGGFRPGIKGGAFSFNGTGYITNQVNRLSGISNSYTMEFWAWPAAARASTPESQSGASGNANQRYAIFPDYNGTAVAGAGVSVGINGVSVFEHTPFSLPSLLVYDTPITNWTHVAVVYSDRQPTLYLNGKLVRVGLMSTKDSNPSTCLGEEGFGYGFYAGLLDEVCIYNRSLAPEEITAIYFAGVHGKCPSLPPSFVRQPVDQFNWPGTVASFSAVSAGSAPLAYQWFHSQSPIAGATQSVLTISMAQPSDAGAYRLQASNSFGIATSQVAQLTVYASNTCIAAPAGLNLWLEGENEIRDSTGTLFNWSVINSDGFRPGIKGQAFSFNGTNSYITNQANRLSGISNSYTMEFWALPAAARASTTENQGDASGIANQRYAIFPDYNGTAVAGVGVSVGINGVSVFEHTPFSLPSLLVYDTPITNWTHVAVVYSGRQPSLYLNGNLVHVGVMSPRDSSPSTCLGEEAFGYGYYAGLLDEVSIYNRVLSPSEIQAIYLAGSKGKCPQPPLIVTQPLDQKIALNATAIFSALAGGSPPLSFQWSFNEVPISGATNRILSLPAVQLSSQGGYRLTASNTAGAAASRLASLVVTGVPPQITVQPMGTVTNLGAIVTMAVSATGSVPLSYFWMQNGSNAVGVNSPMLVLSNVARLDSGLYSVRVSNSVAVVTSSNTLLRVLVPQKIGPAIIFPDGTIAFLSGDADGGLLHDGDLDGFVLKGSSNLVDWESISNALSLTNGMLLIRDPEQADFPKRFYRLLEQ